MVSTLAQPEKVVEQSIKWVWSRPITFAEFLEFIGPEDYVELIDGVVVEKSMVQYEHEKLLTWLNRVLGLYTEDHDLGVVIGSRTTVEINGHRSRLPDLLFVRQERTGIIRQKSLVEAPDLVIELISPNDRPSDIVVLEMDYRAIGVTEIVFIDQQKKRVRVLRKQETGYSDETFDSGALILQTIENIALKTEWLFTEPRPTIRETVAQLESASA